MPSNPEHSASAISTSAASVLPLGAVVTDEISRRGVVVWSNGRGIHGHARMFADDSYVIQTDSGGFVVGNVPDEWTRLPEGRWSAKERVLSAQATWEPPTWPEPAENDEFGFALLRALLPPAIRDDVFGDISWPCSYTELAIEVARWLDRSEQS